MTDEITDSQLLSEYVATQSQDAFGRIVRRYVDLVHGTARRMIFDEHLVQDVAQGTFIVLMKKAHRVNHQTLPGWLVNTTRLLAKDAIRSRHIREKHEARAAALTNRIGQSSDDPTVDQIGPLLDDALSRLSETDRTAVVVRFFEGASFVQVGTRMGSSEEAARKRVTRAVEKLRGIFLAQGIVASTDGLTAMLTAYQVKAAPAAFVSTMTTSLSSGGSTASGNLAHAILSMAKWSKFKLSAALLLSLMLIAGGAWEINQIVRGARHAAPAVVLPKPPDNAADEYRVAFAAFPRNWPDPQQEIPDAKVPALADSVRDAVAHLHLAAAIERCDWGLDYSQGLDLKIPELSGAYDLSLAAIVAARDCWLKGKPGDAYEITGDLICLTRDLDGGYLVMDLSAMAMRSRAVELAARHLPGTPANVMADFSIRLDKIPSMPPLADAMKMDRDASIVTIRNGLKDAESIQKFQHRYGGSLEEWTALSNDPAALDAAIAEMSGLFDLEARDCALTPAEWSAAEKELRAKRNKMGILCMKFMPGFTRICELWLASEIEMKMLRCGIAIFQKGDGEVKNFHDPFDDEPFTLEKINGGFTLTSKFIINGKPLSLGFGPNAVEK